MWGELAAGAAGVAGALAAAVVGGRFAVKGAYRQADAAVTAAREQATAAITAAQVGAREQATAAIIAAREQAAAAIDAAQRGADAQLDVMRQTFRDQAAAAQRAVRRGAYTTFLGAVDQTRAAQLAWITAPTTATRTTWNAAAGPVGDALNIVRLEGPAAVTTTAEALAATVDPATSPAAPPGTFTARHTDFLTAARGALEP